MPEKQDAVLDVVSGEIVARKADKIEINVHPNHACPFSLGTAAEAETLQQAFRE